MAFLNILPSPSFKILSSGIENASGDAGPGYASVKLESETKTMRSRTNSGRHTARNAAHQFWKIDITYNPMTREEFMPVYSFILEKQGGLKPFFVSLPQYEEPRHTDFASSFHRNTLSPNSTIAAGSTSMLAGDLAGTPFDGADGQDGIPLPGDLFFFDDTNNSNHLKAYMITRTERRGTSGVDYDTDEPPLYYCRVHFHPPLAKSVSTSTDLIFSKSGSGAGPLGAGPLIKVVAKDMQSYSLGTDNLYKFSLSLEEVQ